MVGVLRLVLEVLGLLSCVAYILSCVLYVWLFQYTISHVTESAYVTALGSIACASLSSISYSGTRKETRDTRHQAEDRIHQT